LAGYFVRGIPEGVLFPYFIRGPSSGKWGKGGKEEGERRRKGKKEERRGKDSQSSSNP
jgi:hypothetical protein